MGKKYYPKKYQGLYKRISGKNGAELKPLHQKTDRVTITRSFISGKELAHSLVSGAVWEKQSPDYSDEDPYYIGNCVTLHHYLPSGNYYTFWTSNIPKPRTLDLDESFIDGFEKGLSQKGCFSLTSEGDLCGVLICRSDL